MDYHDCAVKQPMESLAPGINRNGPRNVSKCDVVNTGSRSKTRSANWLSSVSSHKRDKEQSTDRLLRRRGTRTSTYMQHIETSFLS